MSFYDGDNMDQKTMAERCREYYDPADFVVIMNIDTEEFQYVIQRPENQVTHQPSPVTKETYFTKDPEVITLQSGQTRVVPAYEADHVIKTLTDKIIYREKRRLETETGKVSHGSAMDPATQHRFIKQIFRGKRDFLSEFNQQLNVTQTVDDEIEKELSGALDENTQRSPGRPKKQVA